MPSKIVGGYVPPALYAHWGGLARAVASSSKCLHGKWFQVPAWQMVVGLVAGICLVARGGLAPSDMGVGARAGMFPVQPGCWGTIFLNPSRVVDRYVLAHAERGGGPLAPVWSLEPFD